MERFDFAAALGSWYEENKRRLPWRETSDPYAIWVSEIMLQQTRVEAVKPYYRRFLEKLPTLEALASADDETLHALWQGLGYYSRVRNMKKAAQTCLEKYGGTLPRSAKELKTLCGIGDYTAGAIASFAFGERVPAVDGNVLRVLARCLGIEKTVTSPEAKREIDRFIREELPEDDPGAFNQALIELGATLCGPDSAAKCGGCPLVSHCRAFAEDKTELLPVRARKPERRVEERTPLILLYEGRAALEKRPGKGLLSGLWQPPAIERKAGEKEVRDYLESRGAKPRSVKALPHAVHVFTHIRWEMSGYLIELDEPGDFTFFSPEERSGLALPSAFKAYFEYIR